MASGKAWAKTISMGIQKLIKPAQKAAV